MLLLIGLVPAISVAVGLVHAVVPRLVPPHRLPKMEFQDGIPRECSAGRHPGADHQAEEVHSCCANSNSTI